MLVTWSKYSFNNEKLFVIKVAKCQQSNILTSIENFKVTFTVLTAKKKQKKNIPQIIGNNKVTFSKLLRKKVFLGHNGPLT
jgi:hypothetical protein